MKPSLIGAGVALAALAGASAWWRYDTAPLALEELKTRQSLPRSRFVEVAGTVVHVVDEGAGPAVVMLHGNVNSLRLWDPWAARLAARGYRVLRFDMPPYGLSGPSRSGRYGSDLTYRILRALLDDLGIGEAVLVGAANGGPPAAWYAANHPRRARGLVLVNTPFVPPAAGFAPGFDSQRWLSENVYKFVGRPSPATAAYVRKLTAGEPVPAAFVRHIHELGRRADVPDPLAAYGSSFAMKSADANPRGIDNRKMLSELRLPVLVMWGGRALLPLEDGQALSAMLSGAPHEYRVYPEGGHWFPAAGQEAPAADVVRFVERAFGRRED